MPVVYNATFAVSSYDISSKVHELIVVDKRPQLFYCVRDKQAFILFLSRDSAATNIYLWVYRGYMTNNS